jgi:oxygen-independent coproporphyrinogen-3 oxidase
MTVDEFNTLFLNEDEIAKGLSYIRLSDPDGFLLSNELISLAFRVIDP